MKLIKSIEVKKKYFRDFDERVYIDLRRGIVHTCEFERVNQDDSDLTITVKLKESATTKNETAFDRVLPRLIYVHVR